MTSSIDASADQVAQLREAWRSATLAGEWLYPDDWHGPAASDMATALARGEDCVTAAGALGADRARRGVGLGEALDDLATLYRVADDSPPPFDVARALAEAWSEVTTDALVARAATDPLTGLGTIDYCRERLRELYATPGTRVSDAYRFVLVRPAANPPHGWHRVLQRCATARVVREVLCSGETAGIAASGVIVGIVAAETALEHAARLRVRVDEGVETAGLRVVVEPPPRTVVEAEDRLLRL